MTERSTADAGSNPTRTDLDVERALVGAILLGAPVKELRTFLQPEHFTQPALGAAYAAALKLDSDGIKVDNVTLAKALEQMAPPAGAGTMLDRLSPPGRAGLSGLIQDCPTHLNAHHYGDLILERAAQRSGGARASTPAPKRVDPGAKPTFIKASELMAKDLPELRWAVRGIQPEGLTLLVGRPKLGKTWLADQLAVASASGGRALGHIPVDAADTLLAPLEDPERRTKSRLALVLDGATVPDRLTIATSWPRLDQRGLEYVEAWAKKHPGGRAYFDTFARIRPAASRNGTLYQDDYAALAGLQTLAGRYSLAIMVVHHTRKLASDDPLETVSGTQGLTGAADTILVLRRDRTHRDATLFVTGRDVEEAEITLRWDPNRCSWSLLGEAMSEEREAIIKLLRHAGKPLSTKDIAMALGRTHEPTRLLCWRMASVGQILSAGKSQYSTTPGYIDKKEEVDIRETPDTADTGETKSVSVYPTFPVSAHARAREEEPDDYGDALMAEPEPDDAEEGE